MTFAGLGLSTILAVLSGGGLAQAPPAGGAAPGTLAGTSWRAVELVGTPVPALPSPDNQPHLVFGTDGRVSGADGCNRLTGSFTENGDAITFGNLAVTSMACVKTDEIERRFQSVLKGTGHWRIEDGRLKFYGATGKPLAVLERREAPPPAAADVLEDTTWQLVKFQSMDDTTLVPDDRSKYTLHFAAGGRLAVRLDCNKGRSTWKSAGPSEITFGPLSMTRAKCAKGSMHDQIVRMWPFIVSYVMRDGHLFLALKMDSGIYEFEPVAPKQP
jgi:heat shock protein HslJ